MCLQYQYSNLDEEVQERQTVTVGKPLVSKLNLYEPRLPRSCSASSSFDLQTFSLPESSSFAEGFGLSSPASETSSIGSASTSWSYYPQSGELSATTSSVTKKVNLPVESECPEVLDSDTPQLLTTSKSLPHGDGDDLTYKFSNMYNFHSY